MEVVESVQVQNLDLNDCKSPEAKADCEEELNFANILDNLLPKQDIHSGKKEPVELAAETCGVFSLFANMPLAQAGAGEKHFEPSAKTGYIPVLAPEPASAHTTVTGTRLESNKDGEISTGLTGLNEIGDDGSKFNISQGVGTQQDDAGECMAQPKDRPTAYVILNNRGRETNLPEPVRIVTESSKPEASRSSEVDPVLPARLNPRKEKAPELIVLKDGELEHVQAGIPLKKPYAEDWMVSKQNRTVFKDIKTTGHKAGVETVEMPKSYEMVELDAESHEIKVNPEKIFEHIAENAKTVLKNGRSEITLQLKPESLGKVSVFLSVEKGSLCARILVENSQTGDALQGGIVELKHSLQQHGLNLEKVEIGYSGGQEFNHDGREYRENPGRKNVQPVVQKEDEALLIEYNVMPTCATINCLV